MNTEIEFNKYKTRGSLHWKEMTSRDLRVFNAFQQARYDWIINTAGDLKGKKVLDVGCGDGSLTYLLARRDTIVVGVDNEELGLDFARDNLKKIDPHNKLQYSFAQASAYELPFEPNSFDVVVSCEVIEHLREPERMLAECKRVLRPGGKLVLTTPYRLTESPRDSNHVLEYFPGEIQGLLQKYFSAVEVMPTHHVLWYSLYSYSFRSFRKRPLGRWALNILVLWFGWNPFMIPYVKKTKFDTFASILAWGVKNNSQ